MVRCARRLCAVVALALVLALVLGACGSSSSNATKGLGPNPTGPNPGPNSTTFDPGPNPTTGGPVTVEGTVLLTPRCFTLQRPQGALDLHFSGYTNQSGALVDDTHTTVAHTGDTIAVSGQPGHTKNACGTRFDVANLVTVIPK
jgi:hypothetical protein